MSRIFNTALRFGTLVTRFLFVFFLAKYLDAADVGYYGMFSATIAFSVLVVGFEYHTYVTRSIARAPIETRGQMIKAHAVVSLALYLILLPFALLLTTQISWPNQIILWFIPILVLEHFNQEVFRLLVIMSKQISASVLLFVRQGSWAIAIVLIMATSSDFRTLASVIAGWMAAGVISALLGIWRIRKLDIGGWATPIDKAWMWRGFAVAIPFLLATLALRGLFTLDRYWLETLGGPEIVGAYVLFFGIASGLTVFLDAGVFSYGYPELIQLHSQGDHWLATRKLRRMLYQTIAISVAFAFFSWLLLPVMLSWIGKPFYLQNSFIFPWVMLAMVLLAVSQVPHWGLYTLGKDKPIIVSHIAGLITFIVATWFTQKSLGPYAVLFGLNATFGLILVCKSVFYLVQVKRTRLRTH